VSSAKLEFSDAIKRKRPRRAQLAQYRFSRRACKAHSRVAPKRNFPEPRKRIDLPTCSVSVLRMLPFRILLRCSSADRPGRQKSSSAPLRTSHKPSQSRSVPRRSPRRCGGWGWTLIRCTVSAARFEIGLPITAWSSTSVRRASPTRSAIQSPARICEARWLRADARSWRSGLHS